jgi:hypothetical protein
VPLDWSQPGVIFYKDRFSASWEPNGGRAEFGVLCGREDDPWFSLIGAVADPRGTWRSTRSLDLAWRGRPILTASTISHRFTWRWRPETV